ncbi:MAG: AbrB/MazE/SpoVT family DNA-binding domain-containing protein [Bryobacteraceae bacterium]|jgi:antitoxin component of MazEF toxin-antitoxin module
MWVCKLIKHGHSRGITIPVEFLRKLGWGIGDLVTVDLEDRTLSVRLLQDVKPQLKLRRPNPEDQPYAEA